MKYVKIIVTTSFFFLLLPSLVKAGEYFNVSVVDEYFCAYITDPATLDLAYRDARGEIRRIVTGGLLIGDGGFNQPWSWHLDPSSVRLVEMAMELCDGRPSYVEKDLEYWFENVRTYCPWVSDIIDIGCSGIITTTTTTTSTTIPCKKSGNCSYSSECCSGYYCGGWPTKTCRRRGGGGGGRNYLLDVTNIIPIAIILAIVILAAVFVFLKFFARKT